jgi:hypothetical protein
MKKALTILFVSLSAILILDSLNAVHALMMFVLAGVIPGTNIALSADRTLEIFTLLIGFTLSRVTLNLIRLRAYEHTTAPKRRVAIASARA